MRDSNDMTDPRIVEIALSCGVPVDVVERAAVEYFLAAIDDAQVTAIEYIIGAAHYVSVTVDAPPEADRTDEDRRARAYTGIRWGFSRR